ncbi:hypothetical protein [Lysobacter enzymogenes]|uniref:hypothetical protein n=1 Tax=Lysobacter enzymogenes TaxID=69 RepID=UPI001116C1BA|nr:hypothetical protein [Lysobacter enzymogenes]UZW62727.1 hypothetical protein BV903_010730 [Lysobacter enzymogenes]
MTELRSIGPQQRAAIAAAYAAPDQSLHRVRGGWSARTDDPSPTVFTTRTLNAMSRDWLVDLSDEFALVAPLTRKGIALAEQLRDPQPYDRSERGYVAAASGSQR